MLTSEKIKYLGCAARMDVLPNFAMRVRIIDVKEAYGQFLFLCAGDQELGNMGIGWKRDVNVLREVPALGEKEMQVYRELFSDYLAK